MTVLPAHPWGGPRASPAATLVALHGIRGHGRRWRFLTPLSGYGLDLRGHGHAPAPPPWTLEQHARDVLDTLDALRADAVDLVGLSFGGAVALHVAAQAPRRLRRLVLLDPAVGLEPAEALERARAAQAAPSFGTVAEARSERARLWPGASAAVVDAEVREHLRQGGDGRWRWSYEPSAVVAAFSEMSRPAPPPPPGVPTLLVCARTGSLVPRAYAADCRAAGVEVQVIDAGHGMDIEAPHLTRALVAGFLER
ncbi:alpha/beta fold hydrolase [Streptomyces sp. NPDC059788]|uniref:alpha/beta fold hydrolase n=1 Tax=Streptomyces sp. NPDC059788 TaxID=3346948 RepID=UPI00364E4B7A